METVAFTRRTCVFARISFLRKRISFSLAVVVVVAVPPSLLLFVVRDDVCSVVLIRRGGIFNKTSSIALDFHMDASERARRSAGRKSDASRDSILVHDPSS